MAFKILLTKRLAIAGCSLYWVSYFDGNNFVGARHVPRIEIGIAQSRNLSNVREAIHTYQARAKIAIQYLNYLKEGKS